MAFWYRIFHNYIYELSYENLIDYPEAEARKLLDYCGLPWDENCLEFHKTSRRVATAGAVVVRQAIYRDSVARWKKYGDQLAPLGQLLEKLPG